MNGVTLQVLHVTLDGLPEDKLERRPHGAREPRYAVPSRRLDVGDL